MAAQQMQIEAQTQYINSILLLNNQQLIKITEENNSLFRAVSKVLFFTEIHYDQILRRCYNLLQKLKEKKKLNKKLSNFQFDLLLFNEYQLKPELPSFESTNYELLSLLFQQNINIYSLDQENYINKLIYSNKYAQTISLFKQNNHYDVVYDLKVIQVQQQCQNQILNEIFGIEKQNTKYFKNIEYQIYVDQGYQQEYDDQKKNQKKHKKSLSDQLGKKSNYNIFTNLNLPQDFLQFLTLKEQNQNMKKISYYYVDDVLEFKTNEINQDQERKNTNNSNYDSNINKILEDFEYEEIKNKMNQQEGKDCSKQQNIQINITNNYIDCVNNIQNIQLNNFQINKSDTKQNNFQTSLNQDNQRYNGYLKFFDEKKNFGFIIKDDDLSDVFVHFDDLQKAIQDKNKLKINKGKGFLRFQFSILKYVGKHSQSRKAIDIQLLNDTFTNEKQSNLNKFQ